MNYIFIDTNLFYDVLTSEDSEKILDRILQKLNDKQGVNFVLPEVIEVEILSQYGYWKDGVIYNIKTNMETKKVLGISEDTDAKSKIPKKQKGQTEIQEINKIIEPSRKQMIKKITGHYDSILKKINQIFRHKNTKTIRITNQVLLAGMKRSLLKRAPCTKAEKPTENAHTKDVDCIAFEALITFCKKLNASDKLIMCVADQDYLTTDGGDLHEDVKRDIKLETQLYKTMFDMLAKELSIKSTNPKKPKTMTGSLAGNDEPLVESSIRPAI